jgi:hypothetical protein
MNEAERYLRGETKRMPCHAVLGKALAAQSAERLASMKMAGIKRVEVLGSGDDCEACHALIGRYFALVDAPQLPPAGCICRPHCRCIIIAVG